MNPVEVGLFDAERRRKIDRVRHAGDVCGTKILGDVVGEVSSRAPEVGGVDEVVIGIDLGDEGVLHGVLAGRTVGQTLQRNLSVKTSGRPRKKLRFRRADNVGVARRVDVNRVAGLSRASPEESRKGDNRIDHQSTIAIADRSLRCQSARGRFRQCNKIPRSRRLIRRRLDR